MCVLVPTQALSGDYIIGDGDTLSVSVWGVPELSTHHNRAPGWKNHAAGGRGCLCHRSDSCAIEPDLTKVLDSYVKKPIVTVAVSAVTNNRIYISGGGVPPK